MAKSFIQFSLLALFYLTLPLWALSFNLVQTINLSQKIPGFTDGGIGMTVVEDELYIADFRLNQIHRLDSATGNHISSFSLSNGILVHDHDMHYNPNTQTILHVGDNDIGGTLTFDSFFETDLNGNLVNGPIDLLNPGDDTEDPEGIARDISTGRIWFSMFDTAQPGSSTGIFEIDPVTGAQINFLNVGDAISLEFSPHSGKLLFADKSNNIKEVNTDGTGVTTIFNPGVGNIFGMGLTPSGDLAITTQTQVLLFDSDIDSDSGFSTDPIIPEASSIGMLCLGILAAISMRVKID